MFDALLSNWQPYLDSTQPLQSPVKLWGDADREVWIDDAWGPAIPYGPIDHGNGHQNFGYMRIKGNALGATSIPEAANWSELQEFLTIFNASGSPVESVGFDKGFFPIVEQSDATIKLGSYFDVMFSDVVLNDRPENFLLLASHLLDAVNGCGAWWGNVSMVLQRMRFISGAKAPWGLMMCVDNYGRSEVEARTFSNCFQI
jgi:hypothetical protein